MIVIARELLTKGFFMALPTGSYLVSNCGNTPGKHVPTFNERVGPAAARQAQWERIKAARAHGRLCNVGETEAPDARQIARKRLTKEFLMALPEGVYIVSNPVVSVTPGPFVPDFEEYVVQPEAREAQWERIKASGANGRHCNVYESSDDHAKRAGRAAN